MIHCDTLGVGCMPGEYSGSEEGVREFIKLTGELAKSFAIWGCTLPITTTLSSSRNITAGAL